MTMSPEASARLILNDGLLGRTTGNESAQWYPLPRLRKTAEYLGNYFVELRHVDMIFRASQRL